jgi:cytochrome P450
MSRDQVATLAMIVLQAGHETTANMISLGTVVLIDNPAQRRALTTADDPGLTECAVEELLRYLTIPHRGRRRVALDDLEIGGQLIRKGEGVIALIDVANRDEAVFPHPGRFDISRGTRQHVAFGFGAHQCLGQSIARVELQVVYHTLFSRIPTLRLAVPAEDLAFRTEGTVYGLESLPVNW